MSEKDHIDNQFLDVNILSSTYCYLGWIAHSNLFYTNSKHRSLNHKFVEFTVTLSKTIHPLRPQENCRLKQQRHGCCNLSPLKRDLAICFSISAYHPQFLNCTMGWNLMSCFWSLVACSHPNLLPFSCKAELNDLEAENKNDLFLLPTGQEQIQPSLWQSATSWNPRALWCLDMLRTQTLQLPVIQNAVYIMYKYRMDYSPS